MFVSPVSTFHLLSTYGVIGPPQVSVENMAKVRALIVEKGDANEKIVQSGIAKEAKVYCTTLSHHLNDHLESSWFNYI